MKKSSGISYEELMGKLDEIRVEYHCRTAITKEQAIFILTARGEFGEPRIPITWQKTMELWNEFSRSNPQLKWGEFKATSSINHWFKRALEMRDNGELK